MRGSQVRVGRHTPHPHCSYVGCWGTIPSLFCSEWPGSTDPGSHADLVDLGQAKFGVSLIGTYLKGCLGCPSCSWRRRELHGGRVISSASPTHREPVPLSLPPDVECVENMSTTQTARSGHYDDEGLEITAVSMSLPVTSGTLEWADRR